MTRTWRHLPTAARPIAAAADAAVTAATVRDSEALAEAVGELAALDPAQTGLILGTTVRLLLEDTHPDGLDGDDIRTVLEGCVRQAAQWQPDLDPHVVLILLAGALGVHDDSGDPPPTPEALARHAPLLLAHLLSPTPPAAEAGRADPAGVGEDGPMADYLTRALAEIERTQLND